MGIIKNIINLLFKVMPHVLLLIIGMGLGLSYILGEDIVLKAENGSVVEGYLLVGAVTALIILYIIKGIKAIKRKTEVK